MHSLLCICGYICSSKTRLSLTIILIFPPFVGLDLCCACCPRPQFNFKLHRGTKTFYSYIHITCTIPKKSLGCVAMYISTIPCPSYIFFFWSKLKKKKIFFMVTRRPNIGPTMLHIMLQNLGIVVAINGDVPISK